MRSSNASRNELRRAARWLAAGLVAAPIINVADDAGVLGAVLMADASAIGGIALGDWAALFFFGGLGVAIAALLPHQSPRLRRWLLFGCAIPCAMYVAVSGLRLSVLAPIVLVGFGYALLRTAEEMAATPVRPRQLEQRIPPSP